MKFDVRNTAGIKLGVVEIRNLMWLRRGEVRFVRARDARFHGTGFLAELPEDQADMSFATLDMKVSEWYERPSISESGEQYRPGRVDYVLLWDGPIEALHQVREFQSMVTR